MQMATPMIKPKQIRVYLRESEIEMLDALVEMTGMKDTAVLTHLCTAALRAAKEVNYRVPLGLRFQIFEPLEPSPPRGTTKKTSPK